MKYLLFLIPTLTLTSTLLAHNTDAMLGPARTTSPAQHPTQTGGITQDPSRSTGQTQPTDTTQRPTQIAGTTQSTDTTQHPTHSTGTTTQHPPQNPALKAARRLTVLADKLDLSETQVEKVRSVLIDEAVSLDSLRTHSSGQKKPDAQARRTISQDTDLRIYTLLNDEQRLKYQQWKLDQKQKRLGKKALQNQADSTSDPQHS